MTHLTRPCAHRLDVHLILKEKPTTKPKEPIPQFANRDKEAAFWDEHDLADYWDDFDRVNGRVAGDLTDNVSARSA